MRMESLTECFTNSFLARKDSPAISFLRDGRTETEISYLELERDSTVSSFSSINH
jgi:hypothetical protein